MVQLGYGLFTVTFFGWLAAALIGVGNGLVCAASQIHPRLVLSPGVGIAAAIAFGNMLFGDGLGATLLLFRQRRLPGRVQHFLVAIGYVDRHRAGFRHGQSRRQG